MGGAYPVHDVSVAPIDAEVHTTGEAYPLNHGADLQLGHLTAISFQP